MNPRADTACNRQPDKVIKYKSEKKNEEHKEERITVHFWNGMEETR